MKILLIYLEKDKAEARTVKALFNKKDFSFKSLVLSIPGESKEAFSVERASCSSTLVYNVEKLKHEYIPSHVLILSRLPKRFLDFIAGYSCANSQPFTVFGENAIAGIPEPFSSYFVLLKSEDDLLKFYQNEKKAYTKIEAERAAEKARFALLKMGISVNVDSMVKCASEGLIHEVSLFLAAGFSPDTLSSNGVPLLCIAARKGSRETLRLLIHSGAQLDLLSHDRGSSALIDSVMGKHKAITKDLIKAGADVNIRSKDGQSALIIAVGASDAGIVQAILEAGADPDATDNLGVSARKYAVLFHNKEVTDLFDHLPISEEH